MAPTVVCSFWVHRPADFPDAADYIGMLKILDRSCRAAGMRHVVLTDFKSSQMLPEGLEFFAAQLPRNLLQATTAAQAEWVRATRYPDDDTVFVGADCLVLHDFRPFLRPADLSICTFPHRKLWIMNGFQAGQVRWTAGKASKHRHQTNRAAFGWPFLLRARQAAENPVFPGFPVTSRNGDAKKTQRKE